MRRLLLVPLVALSGVAVATLPARFVSVIPDPWLAGENLRLTITGPPVGAEITLVFGNQGAIAAPCSGNGPCITVVNPFRTVKTTMSAGGAATWTSPNPLPASFASEELCVQAVARVNNTFISSMPWCEPVTVRGVGDSAGGAPVFIPERQANFANAAAGCESVGMSLYVPMDEADNDLLRALADSWQLGPVWTGADDRATEGVFRDPAGNPVSFTDWGPGSPFDNGSQDCVALDAWGAWDDISCAALLPYVCR